MTDAKQTGAVRPGDTVHALKTGVNVALGNWLGPAHSTIRGQNICITQAILDAAVNRLGVAGGIALAADEDEQMRRWGEVRFRVGPAPEGMLPTRPGDPDHAEAREAARQRAHRIDDPQQRAAALKDVQRTYGAAEPTSRTISQPRESYWEKQAAQQEREREASGLRHTNKSITTAPDEGTRR